MKMQTALRESFVSIFHNKNLLQDFADEIRMQIHEDKRETLKTVPEKELLMFLMSLRAFTFVHNDTLA